MEAKRCTPVDYQYYAKAYQISRVDRDYDIAMQAWANQSVKTTTGGKQPKPKYKQFNQFYNHDKAFYGVFGINPNQHSKLAERNRIWSQISKKGGN